MAGKTKKAKVERRRKRASKYRRKVEKAAKVQGKEAVTSSGPWTCKPLDGSLIAC
jgi:hypothetical protein